MLLKYFTTVPTIFLASILPVTPVIAQNATGLAESAADAVKAEPVEAKLDTPKLAYGYLSDPKTPPKDFLESLFTGKVYLNNRFRVEFADTTGRDSSTAITNRLRLGYETKPFHGFSIFAEMENVATPDKDNYYVPATGDGSPSRTVIAEPPGTELNQAYVRFKTAGLGESDVSLDIKAGRQRIKLDDDRFIGNVGWRQFEQTYDAVSFNSNFGVDKLSVTYVYVWGVQRIFGPDGPNWDSDSHFLRASYTFMPELTAIPFAYLLDFNSDSPANSTNTYGVRFTGQIDRDAENAEDLFYDYELTYARQTDAGANALSFDVDFFAVQGRVTKKGLGALTVGYQFMGSDNGAYGFRFPLGTNHKFQGFADQFLTTPATGLQDLYATVMFEAPYGLKPAITFHQFWSDQGNTDLGQEVDLVVGKKINANWSMLVKAAFFDGRNGGPDTSRIWLETTLQF